MGGAKKKDTAAEGAKAPEAPVVPDEVPEDAKAAEDAKVAEDAKKADRNKKDREARAAKAQAEAEAKARRGHFVGQGKSLTSSKGPVSGAPIGTPVWDGDKVTPQHWTDEVFKRLVADGAVVEVK